jgi:hypothetical protein
MIAYCFFAPAAKIAICKKCRGDTRYKIGARAVYEIALPLFLERLFNNSGSGCFAFVPVIIITQTSFVSADKISGLSLKAMRPGSVVLPCRKGAAAAQQGGK